MVTAIASEWVTAINSESVTAFIVIRMQHAPRDVDRSGAKNVPFTSTPWQSERAVDTCCKSFPAIKAIRRTEEELCTLGQILMSYRDSLTTPVVHMAGYA